MNKKYYYLIGLPFFFGGFILMKLLLNHDENKKELIVDSNNSEVHEFYFKSWESEDGIELEFYDDGDGFMTKEDKDYDFSYRFYDENTKLVLLSKLNISDTLFNFNVVSKKKLVLKDIDNGVIIFK